MARSSSVKHPASWWLVVIAGGLVLVFSVAIIRELVRTRQIRQQLARLRSEVTAEQQRHQQLQDLIAYLSSPTFQEREARLQLGLKKEGERVIVVPTGSNNGSSGNGDRRTGGTGENQSVPIRWWQYFFGSDLPKNQSSS